MKGFEKETNTERKHVYILYNYFKLLHPEEKNILC